MKRTYVPHMLGAIFVSFIGIMIYVYIEARAANPILLDEHGNIRGGARR